MKILIVDDDDDHRELLKTLCIKRGLEVVTARNGMQAITNFARSLKSRCLFDLAILDAPIPVINGSAVARAIRACESGALSVTPCEIIFYTGNAKILRETSVSLETHARAVVAKPNIDALIAALEAVGISKEASQ